MKLWSYIDYFKELDVSLTCHMYVMSTKVNGRKHSARDFHLSSPPPPRQVVFAACRWAILGAQTPGVHLSLLSQPHHFYFYIIKIFNVFAGQWTQAFLIAWQPFTNWAISPKPAQRFVGQMSVVRHLIEPMNNIMVNMCIQEMLPNTLAFCPLFYKTYDGRN